MSDGNLEKLVGASAAELACETYAMSLYRSRAQVQPLGNFPASEILGQESQDAHLRA